MISKNFSICDINFKIITPFDYDLGDNFKKFISEEKEEDISYVFEKGSEEIEFNIDPIYSSDDTYIFIKDNKIFRKVIDNKYLTTRAVIVQDFMHLNKNKYYYYLDEKYFKTSTGVFRFMQLEQSLSLFNAFILHSSQIKYNNKSILFTGPSGIGKSTQAHLWEKFKNAKILNGDKSGIRKINDVWLSYGLPFSGSDKYYNNVSTPIGAIVVLKQGKENKIEKLSPAKAFRYIYGETAISLWHEVFTKPIVEAILELVKKVPIYLFSCTQDESAVVFLENELERDRV